MKYRARNWQQGLALTTFLNGMWDHLAKLTDLGGDEDCITPEDHATAIAWNAFGYTWTLDRIQRGFLPACLDDRDLMVVGPVGYEPPDEGIVRLNGGVLESTLYVAKAGGKIEKVWEIPDRQPSVEPSLPLSLLKKLVSPNLYATILRDAERAMDLEAASRVPQDRDDTFPLK